VLDVASALQRRELQIIGRAWPARRPACAQTHAAEAGSASGSLSAVQQLAAAIGSAVVTTVYFSQRAQHGAGHAMTVSVAVVAAIAVLCLGLVWLLPRSAAEDQH
jgi:hypothetical protein